ncbi:MAG: hypothetical protein AMXMBFR84_05300 [Candidatus Hydrogenedentota bacterium]
MTAEARTRVSLDTRTNPGWTSWVLFLIILIFFFGSGACGLVYQVVWTRKLVLLLGTASYAVSTVLSVFFLGLGVGSLWGGRLADRSARPLFLYGVFEILIGVWAAVFILTVDHVEALAIPLLRLGESARLTGVGIRALLALAFLIVPVTLMGATLPLLARYVTRQKSYWGGRVGSLYSLNTFGAVAGCASAGFLLLPALGYTRSTFLGVLVNVLIGLAALAMSRATERGSHIEQEPESDVDPETVRSKATPAVLIAFAVSGFCFLALEVFWTRLLTIVFLGTTYAYTTMLTTVLCGIALGSLCAAAFVDRIKRPVLTYGIVQSMTAVACLAMMPLLAQLPDYFAAAQQDAGYTWDPMIWSKFRLSFAMLFAPTFLFGMSFPFAVRALTALNPRRIGRDVGLLYGFNTLGGVVGAFAAGFVLISWIGTHNGILAMGLFIAVSGILLIVSCPESKAAWKTGFGMSTAVATVVAVFLLPDDVGLAMNRSYMPEDHRLITVHEGIEGTVAVTEPIEKESGRDRALWINGVQATVSIEKGIKMNRFQGVLPLLFDRDPKRVLFMCFGSGITCGTLGMSDFESIDAVEISPDVLRAAPLFAIDNFSVVSNPKVTFHVDDGRNFLLRTAKMYDVITFEPMPLALAGVSTFYTQDYYRLCLERLSPGGLVSQWVPLHSLNPEVVRSLVRTFREVFPEYCAWFLNADMFLIGSNQPLRLDYARAQALMKNEPLAQALADVGLPDLPELYANFVLSKEGVEQFSQDGRTMSDDRPWAEFEAPKLIYKRSVQESLAAIRSVQTSPLDYLDFSGLPEPEQAAAREAVARRVEARKVDLEGVQLFYGGMVGSGQESKFLEALAVDPLDANARHYLREMAENHAKIYVDWEDYATLEEFLNKLQAAMGEDLSLELAFGDLRFAQGQVEAARVHYRRYVELGGTEVRANARLEETLAPNRDS